jgi:cell division protein FtsW
LKNTILVSNKNEKGKVKKIKGDIFIPIAVIFLAIIGTVFIYSASNYSAKATYGDEFYFVKKQIIGIILGIAAMIFTAFFDYRKIKKIVPKFA